MTDNKQPILEASVEALTLNDIAGYDDEKREAEKIIAIFNNYENLKSLGIDIPKGLILSGMPGVGKTLMAKVIASEAKVPLFEIKSNDDGDPAREIKRVYAEARKHIPCIVLVDEIDKYCAVEHFITDESRTVLKTLLTEIDGPNSSNGVMTLATANDYNELPSSIRRSGRLDKHIYFDMPDTANREAVLKLYLKDKSNIAEANVKELARKTKSFSCADLKTLINETLLEAISSGKQKAVHKDFLRQIPLISIKGIRKTRVGEVPDPIVYHELGHFICSYKLNNEVPSISVEKVGRVEGFVMAITDKDDSSYSSFTDLKNRGVIVLGGYAAEKFFLNETYDGVASDFDNFQYIIGRMAASGMLGVENIFETQTKRYRMYEPFNPVSSDFSNIDIKVKCFQEYLEIATKLIEENKDLILYLFDYVKDAKALEPEDMEELVQKYYQEKESQSQ